MCFWGFSTAGVASEDILGLCLSVVDGLLSLLENGISFLLFVSDRALMGLSVPVFGFFKAFSGEKIWLLIDVVMSREELPDGREATIQADRNLGNWGDKTDLPPLEVADDSFALRYEINQGLLIHATRTVCRPERALAMGRVSSRVGSNCLPGEKTKYLGTVKTGFQTRGQTGYRYTISSSRHQGKREERKT